MGSEGALAITIPSILEEQVDPIDWEFPPTLDIVADLTFKLERQIEIGKKQLTCNEDPEDKADQAAQAK